MSAPTGSAISMPPASTFKIPHALFALDAGVASDLPKRESIAREILRSIDALPASD